MSKYENTIQFTSLQTCVGYLTLSKPDSVYQCVYSVTSNQTRYISNKNATFIIAQHTPRHVYISCIPRNAINPISYNNSPLVGEISWREV